MRLFVLTEISEYEDIFSLLSAFQDKKKHHEVILDILSFASNISNADGYFIYKVTPSKYINLEYLHIKSLRLEFKGSSCDRLFPPAYIPDAKNKKLKRPIEICALVNDIINTPNVYNEPDIDTTNLKRLDLDYDYNCVSLLTIPLSDSNGRLISIIQFLNSQTSSGKITNFSEAIQKKIFSICQLIAIILERQQQNEIYHQFIESFISVLSKIIYSKSPHTASHNRKVPIIAQMLALAVTTNNDEPYKNFEMSDSDWNILNISSLLHDCGKTIVPDYILNKATKLETCTNRIHEIRNRFEILRRDAHIEYLQKRLNNISDKETLQAEFVEKVKKLHDDFEFIGKCNQATSKLTDKDLAKIDEIASQTYTRYFSRTVGLSKDELQNVSIDKANKSETENLLQDRLEQLNAPFHNGEIFNLKTMKGTINDIERSKIKEHASNTLDILSEIPFPQDYSDILDIIKTHKNIMKETKDSKTNDRSKTTIIGKIIAFASVFEQLSSSETPYNNIKKLSEVLKIMQAQKNSGILDADLYNIFIKNEIYIDYAKEYLDPSQIDEINIEEIL